MSAPVLAPVGAFAIPLPSEPGYAWSWVAPDETGAWIERTDLPPPNPKVTVITAPQELSEGWLRLAKPEPAGKEAG